MLCSSCTISPALSCVSPLLVWPCAAAVVNAAKPCWFCPCQSQLTHTAVLPVWAVEGSRAGGRGERGNMQKAPEEGEARASGRVWTRHICEDKTLQARPADFPQPLCLHSRSHCQRYCAPEVSPVQNNQKVVATPKELKVKSLGRKALAWLH